MKLIKKEQHEALKKIVEDLTQLCVETYDTTNYPHQAFRFMSASVDMLRTLQEFLEALQPELREEL